MLYLVIGGARSGKTRYAMAEIEKTPSPWCYMATAQSLDAEMDMRIAQHQQERGAGWNTLEVPFTVFSALHNMPSCPVVIDCMTMWLTNIMLNGYDIAKEKKEILAALEGYSKKQLVVVVSNEVGWGIVPENALARQFRDEAGKLNQALAQLADRVVMMVAGLPLAIK